MRVTLLLARADNGVIGQGQTIPWHIPGEQKHFKALTMGKPMAMGRRTFESLPGLLPGRRHIVLTRDAAWRAAGAEVAHSVDVALGMAGDGDVAVIGGAEVFALLLDRADRVELTEVHATPAGDVMVPAFVGWREVAREDHAADSQRPAFSFVTLTR